jgi:FKBP-type peptidyl-prolyl cis-trans isomerase
MAMHVNDATGGAANGQLQVRDSAPKSAQKNGENGRSFLEVFRRLPEERFQGSAGGLKVATLSEGQGLAASAGMKLKVQYSGWLEDGTRFDSSVERGKPFEFTLGAGRVIKGWEEGLAGIKPGERRQLVIPASLAYGNRKMGDIPPGSTLIFNVEAVAVEQPAAHPKGTMTVVA